MTINEMHFSFRLGIDKVNSFQADDFNPAQIDWLLNLAQDCELEKRYGVNNLNRQGFQVTQKRFDDLKTIHVKSPPDQPAVLVTAVGSLLDNNMYECKLSDLKYTYYLLTGLRASVTKGSCTKTIGLTECQEDDLSEALINANTKPDFNWGVALFTMDKTSDSSSAPGSIYVYSGDFTVNSVYPSYIKKPRNMFFSGYDSLNGEYVTADSQVECELPEIIHRNIVDTAVELASANIQDQDYLQLAKYKSDKFEY